MPRAPLARRTHADPRGRTYPLVGLLQLAGAKVVRAVCICDRLQGATEALKGYDYRPLFTVRDFGINPESA